MGWLKSSKLTKAFLIVTLVVQMITLAYANADIQTYESSLSIPQGIVINANQKSITIEWQAVENATSYEIFLDGEIINNGDECSFNINLLENLDKKQLILKVRAQNDINISEWTDEQHIVVSDYIKIAEKTDEIDEIINEEIEQDEDNLESEIENTEENNQEEDIKNEQEIDSNVNENNEVVEKNNVTPASISELSQPQNLQVINQEDGLKITWQAVENAQLYVLTINGAEYETTEPQYIYSTNKESNYTVTVKAVAGELESELSDEVSYVTKQLSKPQNLHVEDQDDSLKITWQAVENAQSYMLTINGADYETTEPQYIYNSNNESSYTITVKAVAGELESELSDEVSYVTKQLSKPQNLQVENQEESLKITWQAVVNAQSYVLTINGAEYETTEPQYIYSTNNESNYTITVKAVAGELVSELSDEFSYVTKQLSKPQNLQVEDQEGSLKITWQAVEDAQSYLLTINGEEYETTEPQYIYTKNNESNYTVTVKAVAGELESELSDEVSYVTKQLSKPQNLQVENQEDSLKITWQAVVNAQSYVLRINGAEYETTEPQYIYNSNNESNYTITVKAVVGELESDLSDEVSYVTKQLSKPQNLQVENQEDSLKITWQAVVNAQSYVLTINGAEYETTEPQYIYNSNNESNYTITVKAVAGELESDLSDELVYTPKQKTLYEGEGTADNPYIVDSVEKLTGIRNELSACYLLVRDIDLHSITNWQAIGSLEKPFTGQFKGNYFKITNLSINSEQDNQGFFGCVAENAVIKNLDIEVSSNNIHGNDRVGALVGFVNLNEGKIENCNVIGNGLVSGNNYVGALFGEVNNTNANAYIANCYVSVKVNANQYVGGLAGSFKNGRIKNCVSTSSVSGSDYVGGLLGAFFPTDSILSDISYNIVLGSLNITNSQSQNIGSLIGYVEDSSNSKKAIRSNYSTIGVPRNLANDVPSFDYGNSSISNLDIFNWDFSLKDFFNNYSIEIDPYLAQLLGLGDSSLAEMMAGGSGTVNDPYLISTPKQLANIKFDLNANYKLLNDINMIDYGVWKPLGSLLSPFTGSLNGNHYTIKNFTVKNVMAIRAGLFSSLGTGCKIKDLRIELSNEGVNGLNEVGALAGAITASTATIRNVSIIGGSITGISDVGGLFGKAEFNNSENCLIENCYSTATINSNYDLKLYNIGGLIGSLKNGTVSKCYANSTVQGKRCVGGLIGTASSTYNNSFTVINCFATGDLLAADSFFGAYAGGLIGKVNSKNSSKIQNSYASVSINSSKKQANGLVGCIEKNNLSVLDSYFNSTINSNFETNSYNKGLTETEMMEINSYSNWSMSENNNADTVWLINQNNSLPWLSTMVNPYNSVGDIPVTGINIINKNITLQLKQGTEVYEYLNVEIVPHNASNKQLKYISSDSSVVTVDENGKVVAVSLGTATITATSNDGTFKDTCQVTILKDSSMYAGEGTKENPYLIDSVEKLIRVKDNLQASYKVINDLDLSGYKWLALGDVKEPFTGTFNGGNFTISNLTINSLRNNQGLFGCIADNAEVINTKISISETGVKALDRVGALAGYVSLNQGSINNCCVTGKGKIRGSSYVGGLIGQINNKSQNATISNCYAEINVNAILNHAGGFTGSFNNGVIKNSYSNGFVEAYDYVGGFIGSSFVKGSIESTIYNISVYGSVNARNLLASTFIGTVVGYIDEVDNAKFNITKAICAVQLPNEDYNYLKSGLVCGNSNSEKYINMQDLYIDGIVAGVEAQNSVEVQVSKLTIEMVKQENLKGLDFENTWAIDEGLSYPYLQSLKKPNVKPNINNIMAGGLGTLQDPYLISNAKHLSNIRYSLKANYALQKDIDLPDNHWWAIATQNAPFTGSLNGNNYTVSNLSISANFNSNIGLFAALGDNCNIYNLKINIGGNGVTGLNQVGGLAGYVKAANAKIINVSISGGNIAGLDNVGGLFGYVNFTNNNCLIKNCFNKANINFNKIFLGSRVGGLIGYLKNGKIENCYASGIVRASNQVGGLIGKVTASSGSSFAIKNSFAVGEVVAFNFMFKDYAGGFIGMVCNESSSDCSISNSYASSDVIYANNEANGFIGYVDRAINVDDCYFNTDINKHFYENKYNKPISAENLKQLSTFNNWDIAENHSYAHTWNIISGFTYPWLSSLDKPSWLGSSEYIMVKSVSFNCDSYTLKLQDGQTVKQQLELNINPNDATNKLVEYTSSNEQVATVDKHGNITAVGLGEAIITVKTADGDFTDTCSVIVINSDIPQIPQGVKAINKHNSIELNWNLVLGATSYEIKINDNLVEVDDSKYIFNNPQLNNKYSFKVRAINECGTSEWSEPITKVFAEVVELTPPQNIVLTPYRTKIQLAWCAVENATMYEVENYGTVVYCGCNTDFVMNDLTPNTQYAFKIRAKNEDTESFWSNVYAQKTLTDIPKNINVTATDNQLKINWDTVSGASAYDLEVDGVIQEVIANEFVHNSVTPGSVHSYRVRSKSNLGASDWSSLISNSAMLSKPTNFKATAKANYINLSWDKVAEATQYEIEIDGEIIKTAELTYKHENLVANSVHSYCVRAVNINCTGIWSDKIHTTALVQGELVLEAFRTTNYIQVSWNKLTGATHYEIEVDGQVINVGDSDYYDHKHLAANTSHTYRVRACNAGGSTAWSGYLTAKTKRDINLVLSSKATSTTVDLSWSEVNGASYKVLIDGKWKSVGTKTSYTDKNLEPNNLYIYRVKAIVNGDSTTETIKQFTMVDIPKNIVNKPTVNEILISFNPVEDALGYEIEVDGNIININNEVKYKHERLLPNTWHEYRVRAYNSRGKGDWSELIKVMTVPSIDVNLVFTEVTTSSISLEWDKKEEIKAFDIEVDGKIFENLTEAKYLHEGLDSNTIHQYRVRVKNETAISEWTEIYEKATIPELTLNVGEGKQINFVMVIPYLKDTNERKITFTYDVKEIEIVDLCAITPEIETEVGDIKGTNLSVVSYKPGEIVFLAKNVTKTLVNSIKLLANSSNDSKVTYCVE
ncbi:Ig-like domain-containing protein [Clostridium sp. 'deep sea']|uniref:fibronectin type III domain-containing protein n=1 Tax=Clostridium sp. 'deep sea' TaxID=2779445 RepID=UPI001896495A|nr:Ig-like domain-containing protein [Clostridium sp. 'deep sea']QOR35899.1 Ig-like domain-containing protein [Clostridium sp. 'deep sea']